MQMKSHRRDFFKKISAKKTHQNKPSSLKEADPLFKKYSRKIAGRAGGNKTGTAVRVGPVSSGLAIYTGSFGDWEKKHLINRVTFGFRKTDLALLNGLSVSQAITFASIVASIS